MTLQVLGPEADKIKSLYHFVNDATKQFVENVRKLSHPEVLKGFISQTTKLTLGRMLDMFALLDRMKNVKSSLSNDFSFWKRAHSFLNQEQKSKDPQDIMEVQHIGLWLATQRSIEQNLEQELLKIDNYQDALAEIVNECASLLENESYVLSSEKHMLLKTAAFGLYLMDLGEPKKSIYKNKGKIYWALSHGAPLISASFDFALDTLLCDYRIIERRRYVRHCEFVSCYSTLCVAGCSFVESLTSNTH